MTIEPDSVAGFGICSETTWNLLLPPSPKTQRDSVERKHSQQQQQLQLHERVLALPKSAMQYHALS